MNGERFSTRLLKEIYAFDNMNSYSMDLLLEVLEDRNLIEFVYQDGQGDKVFRFTHKFLRETLYQMMINEGQRKQAHNKVSSFLQENILFGWLTDVVWDFNDFVVEFPKGTGDAAPKPAGRGRGAE